MSSLVVSFVRFWRLFLLLRRDLLIFLLRIRLGLELGLGLWYGLRIWLLLSRSRSFLLGLRLRVGEAMKFFV
jgi:hypothetical protein